MTVTYETANLVQPFAYGRGYPTLNRPVNPAAGAAQTVSVPGSRVYRLLSAQYTLTTSAAVANRSPRIRFLDGDGVEWLRAPIGAAIVASSTAVIQWHSGMADYYTPTGGGGMIPLPDLLIPSGHQIELSVGAIDVADTITGISLFWEEFPIGGQGFPVGVQLAFPPELH